MKFIIYTVMHHMTFIKYPMRKVTSKSLSVRFARVTKIFAPYRLETLKVPDQIFSNKQNR